jgi:predicted 2-oxoglutarate/Fe(II)-dependent dioxygenase YbiX
MNIDKEFFDANGYCVIKNVFSLEEISDFRNIAYDTLKDDEKNNMVTHIVEKNKNVYYTKGDLLSKRLNKLLLSDQILKIAEAILGSTPVYFSDSTYQIGVGDRGFHRDNVDRVASQGEDWDGDYDIIRMGIYMQDHDIYSGGLKVIKGSHKGENIKRVFVNSKAGDVVVWNLKTLHSGNAAKLKMFPNLVLGSRLENKLPKFLFKDTQQERISCFMSFAKEGKHLDRYIDKYMKVKMVEHVKNSPYPDEVLTENVILKKLNF